MNGRTDNYRSLTIPWLIEGNEQYGVRSATRDLLCALRDIELTCPVIAMSDGEFARECADLSFDVIELGLERLHPYHGTVADKALQFISRRRDESRARRAVTAVLQSLGADALNFCRPTLVGVAGPAAYRCGVKSFWHVPNAISARYPVQINRRMYQFWCARFGIVPLPNSEYTASTLGSFPVKPKVLYLGVDPRRFDSENLAPISRSTLGIAATSLVVGIVARLDPAKGQAVVMEAVLRLAADGYDIHLVVVGGPTSGAYFEKMKAVLDRSAQRSRVHFVGPVTDVERYYRLFDLSINSTLVPEAFGLSVIESMMGGCPVLVHALGGPVETVLDGVTGWHYFGTDPDSVAKALTRAIGDRARWPVMGAAARKHALEHFSLEIQARNYVELLQDVLTDRRPTASAKA